MTIVTVAETPEFQRRARAICMASARAMRRRRARLKMPAALAAHGAPA